MRARLVYKMLNIYIYSFCVEKVLLYLMKSLGKRISKNEHNFIKLAYLKERCSHLLWIHWKSSRGNIGEIVSYINGWPSNRGTWYEKLIWRIDEGEFGINIIHSMELYCNYIDRIQIRILKILLNFFRP